MSSHLDQLDESFLIRKLYLIPKRLLCAATFMLKISLWLQRPCSFRPHYCGHQFNDWTGSIIDARYLIDQYYSSNDASSNTYGSSG